MKSFVRYVQRLNPLCHSFFQQPRDAPIEGIYFKNVPLGHNKLGDMMKTLSEQAGLSKKYTNHSLRATTVHVLDAARIPSRHIMTVTGHKSVTSLKTYSGQTDMNTKKFMSRKLSEKTNVMNTPTLQNNIPDLPLLPLTNSQELAVIEDVLHDSFDNSAVCNETNLAMSSETECQIQSQQQFVANSFNFNDTRQSPFPVFNNCSNITVNCYMYPGQQ